ncbi:MAG: methyltransferase domain-containing protein [Alphaproteobacteria bacterium]|nr:methyltransferase domain-containing protein [Alphaproteobacteria bacterium]
MYREEKATGEAALPSIDSIPRATHDEAARQKYVAFLRKFVMADLAQDMRTVYDNAVEPAFRSKNGGSPEDARTVRKAMEPNTFYRTWSSLRYNAQEMTWSSVQGEVERALPDLIAVADKAAAQSPAGGTLRLNSDLPIPKAVSALDIHLMPGCFHTEYRDEDVAVGAVYAHGTKVFSGALKMAKNPGKGGVADSIGHYLKLKYPGFKPKRILDLGCTIGSNLLPFHRAFPDAELYGVDVGAPVLRYGHARAEAQGITAHYSQQNAEDMDFDDGMFDLIVSSFFFHEIAVPSTKKILKEVNRVLAPGGVTIHMELPPSNAMDPYYNFFLDWDAYHNHEPHYAAFRQQDPVALLTEAGFSAESSSLIRIPDRGGVSDDDFAAFARGEAEAPQHSNFSSYYLFGAGK